MYVRVEELCLCQGRPGAVCMSGWSCIKSNWPHQAMCHVEL